MTSQVRIGIAGVGRIGRMHAEILTRHTLRATVIAVADAQEHLAVEVADDLRVGVLSVDELIDSPDIDAVAICTPSSTHVDLIVRAAAAGKAIFCEKPISLDLDEVDRALCAIESSGVPFMVGFNRRFDPSHRSVQMRVQLGDVGDVHLARITSRDPEPPPLSYVVNSGGMFVDMTIHDFDMARFVVGSPVVEVFAKGAALIDPAFADAGDVDTAVIVLTHANGALTTIDNSRQAVYGYDQRVEVFGSAGVAMSENVPRDAARLITVDGEVGATLQHFFLDRYRESYLDEWTAFIDYVADGGKSPISGADGRSALAIGIAAWQSVRESRPIAIGRG
ncbi:MAG: inositol 2-dehydrogenase [Actinomycetota bacterium]|nr:inositol 2-dehydrogenase [Actinomycetota bacterium]